MMAREKEWAPCAHTDEEKENARNWLIEVLNADSLGDVEGDPLGNDFSSLERILWIIGLENWPFSMTFSFISDQWVAVLARVKFDDGTEKELWTEGDNFTLAMAKTLERLRKERSKTAGT
jgi:hypothetical protein